ncbi:Hypothetical predicted protein [Paramuricea clavata]|uniref:Uncharacterized protein n=1 Tax=Paramuricea clavata TaxID=317549 RepID=A0A7D9HPR8_PARCT|nr:Hypothetical predicted protein [Paramuricea clavata]
MSMNELAERIGDDEISEPEERLTQSWNGFINIDSRPNDEFHRNFRQLDMHEQTADRMKNKASSFSTNFDVTKQTKPRSANYKTFESRDKKLLKMPKSFPGVKTTEYMAEKSEEKPSTKIVETDKQAETKLNLDDLEKVLTPRRERNSEKKNRSGEKLPRIKITRTKTEISNERKSGMASPQGASHAFNCARMLTELNEVCSLKSEGVAGKSEDNLLQLRTVHQARRYSTFTPRGKIERFSHTRCRSLPNLSSRERPKRFFVKLDPLRASAMQVNLSSWNETSRRCRVLSENLYKLDKQGIEPNEAERKRLIGQWIRETSQSEFEDNHVTEVET